MSIDSKSRAPKESTASTSSDAPASKQTRRAQDKLGNSAIQERIAELAKDEPRQADQLVTSVLVRLGIDQLTATELALGIDALSKVDFDPLAELVQTEEGLDIAVEPDKIISAKTMPLGKVLSDPRFTEYLDWTVRAITGQKGPDAPTEELLLFWQNLGMSPDIAKALAIRLTGTKKDEEEEKKGFAAGPQRAATNLVNAVVGVVAPSKFLA